MQLAIFGLTVSSSWGNGHATIWRGLLRALVGRGHTVTFFERDVPYYARHRDLQTGQGYDLVLYKDWSAIEAQAREVVARSDSAMVTSYCPDALPASELILHSAATLRVFYDLDSPVTLERHRRGETVEYLPPAGLAGFDLVLSYAGGATLEAMRRELGARCVAPLYGSADPAIHKPAPVTARYESDLSYLGTYAADRQPALEELFLKPAHGNPDKKFLIGGAMYPDSFPWMGNIWFVDHVPPAEHPAFYSSSALTLNVTRKPMAQTGYCPSGRLFEAAACETPVVSDHWAGLEEFFEPGREIMTAACAKDVQDAVALDPAELQRVGAAARVRVLAQHTAQHRADELIHMLEAAA